MVLLTTPTRPSSENSSKIRGRGMKFGSSDAFTAAATPIGSTRRANSATVGWELGMATMVGDVVQGKPHVATSALTPPTAGQHPVRARSPRLRVAQNAVRLAAAAPPNRTITSAADRIQAVHGSPQSSPRDRRGGPVERLGWWARRAPWPFAIALRLSFLHPFPLLTIQTILKRHIDTPNVQYGALLRPPRPKASPSCRRHRRYGLLALRVRFQSPSL